MKKPKLTIGKASQPVQLGASAFNKAPNPLMAESKSIRKDYKKRGVRGASGSKEDQVNVSFGQTGLTGES